MRLINQLLSLAPAPLFYIGAVVNVIMPASVCTAWPYEMAVMWFVMALAHTGNWLVFWERRRYTRLTRPDKQQ